MNEVALDYNSGFQMAVAGLLNDIKGIGFGEKTFITLHEKYLTRLYYRATNCSTNGSTNGWNNGRNGPNCNDKRSKQQLPRRKP